MQVARCYHRHSVIGALGKNHAVKGAVENISECAGQNKRGTELEAFVISFPGKKKEVNNNAEYGHNTKYAQEQFTPLAGKLKPKSHTIVFGKIELKPVANYRQFFAKGKMQFNPNLQPLV